MTDHDRLIAFVADRLDETARAATDAATAVGGDTWGVDSNGDVVLEPPGTPVDVDEGDPILIPDLVGEMNGAGWHVAMHSPARVTADIEGRRRMLRLVQIFTANPASTEATVALLLLRAVAEAWSEHPDYDQSWWPPPD
ncbi:DUF6221 family protein [Phytoactinopolyspora limicola]|uniref:DUF6221 family protein n=1 Tax=Phytoactinopolyspora limicola TaxID=2715536 RepID=UPI00140B42C7|nr:DUF6221 family protein [Phytoactinopolyspora limicola]